jgi:UDP-N-acetylmuramate--alanine ligase
VSEVYAHFIGIGGAGMSGIAKVLHERGRSVTGSDMRESRYSAALAAMGVPVSIGHDAANLGDPEVVVVSTAIPDTNPELVEARRRGLTVWPRARMLAELAGDRLTVAVAGTHGKTSTSSMAAAAFLAAGEDPTFLIGGEVTGLGTNARGGTGRHYIVEADESDGSFLLLDPTCAIVTNIEADHLDHYDSLEEIVETFEAFLSHIRPGGVAVLCADDPILRSIACARDGRTITYGTAADADVRLVSYAPTPEGGAFEVSFPDRGPVTCSVGIPGEHMALNATAVLAAAWALGVDVDLAGAGIAAFVGVKRRFECVGTVDGVRVIDDYAHHPTEVRATLAAARSSAEAGLWVVFQPHRYSRTEALSREFGEAFGDADRVVLLDVYSAGEAPIPGVSGKTLVDSVLRSHPRTRMAYFPHRAAVAGYIAQRARPGDLVLTMGAGDVTTMGSEIIRALSERQASTAGAA